MTELSSGQWALAYRRRAHHSDDNTEPICTVQRMVGMLRMEPLKFRRGISEKSSLREAEMFPEVKSLSCSGQADWVWGLWLCHTVGFPRAQLEPVHPGLGVTASKDNN